MRELMLDSLQDSTEPRFMTARQFPGLVSKRFPTFQVKGRTLPVRAI